MCRKSIRPIAQSSALMSNSDDEKLVLLNDVHETVGETQKRFRVHAVIDYRRDIRIPLDRSRCDINVFEEAVAQPQAFRS